VNEKRLELKFCGIFLYKFYHWFATYRDLHDGDNKIIKLCNNIFLIMKLQIILCLYFTTVAVIFLRFI
jgi:hypothetical protein